MHPIEDLLHQHPFFGQFDNATIALLAGCGSNVHFHPGEALFHESGQADAFFVVRTGRVSIQVHDPAVGDVVVDTVDAGEVVGWSWIVAPYRWSFDAVATLETSAVRFDAECLRAKCDADPAVGYTFLRQVTQVMAHRLTSARTRLLDLYGERS